MPVLFPSLSTVPIQTNQTPTPQWTTASELVTRRRSKCWQIYTTLQLTHTYTHLRTRLTAASPGTLSGDQQIETKIERKKSSIPSNEKASQSWAMTSCPLLSKPLFRTLWVSQDSFFPQKAQKHNTLLPPMSFYKNRCLFHFQNLKSKSNIYIYIRQCLYILNGIVSS